MGSKHKKIEIGTKYNKLTVVSNAGVDLRNKTLCNVVCDCGNTSVAYATELRSGHKKSCGCFRVENSSKINTTHGHTKGKLLSREFVAWCSMIQRCSDPNVKSYKNYGAKGIKVCDSWLNSFDNFYKDMGNKPTLKHSIDRINNSGNYEPSNCRWATAKEQMNNMSRNKIVNFKNKDMTVTEASEASGITYATLLARVKSKNKDYFNPKIQLNPKKIVLNMETGIYYESMTEAAKSIGVKPITFMKSIERKGQYKSFNNAF